MGFEILADDQLIPRGVRACIESVLMLDYVAAGGAIKFHSVESTLGIDLSVG